MRSFVMYTTGGLYIRKQRVPDRGYATFALISFTNAGVNAAPEV